jgi:flavodoxin
MKSLVVFDSLYGNTHKVAETVAEALKGKAISADSIDVSDLSGIDTLVVGSPVHGGRPSPQMQAWLKSIPEGSLKGVKVAAFDTRMDIWITKLLGYAAPKIEQRLLECGGTRVADNVGFIVTQKEGPLKPGELDRATAWAN